MPFHRHWSACAAGDERVEPARQQQATTIMPGSITEALERWKQGDDAAQFDLERELTPVLAEMIRRVRRHVASPLKARIDSEAIVYQAFKSCLTGLRKDEFRALNNRADLAKLLKTLVDRALTSQIRGHRRHKRTPYLEQPGRRASSRSARFQSGLLAGNV
jgi:hypothetical protein